LIRSLRGSPGALLRSFVHFSLAVLLFGLGACTTVAPPAAPKPPVPQWEPDKLTASLKQRAEKFRSLRALAQIDYAGPEGKHGFEEAVIVQRPDSVRLETLTFLGAILIFTANDKEMLGYHPREGVFVRAQPAKENLRRYTQISLDLREVTLLLLGLPPIDANASGKQEGNTLVFSSNGRKRDVLTFDSPEPVPTRWERFNDNGQVELSAQFNDYVATSSGLFPQTVMSEAPLQKKKLSIRYKEPEFNGSIPPELFTQQIPAHAKEVPIEAVGN
jgi:uncharacterized protein DUF4292